METKTNLTCHTKTKTLTSQTKLRNDKFKTEIVEDFCQTNLRWNANHAISWMGKLRENE